MSHAANSHGARGCWIWAALSPAPPNSSVNSPFPSHLWCAVCQDRPGLQGWVGQILGKVTTLCPVSSPSTNQGQAACPSDGFPPSRVCGLQTSAPYFPPPNVLSQTEMELVRKQIPPAHTYLSGNTVGSVLCAVTWLDMALP